MCGKGWMGIHSSESNKGKPQRGRAFFTRGDMGLWGKVKSCDKFFRESDKNQLKANSEAAGCSLHLTQ